MLTRASFQPIDDKFSIAGAQNHDIALSAPEPLYLEYAATAVGDQQIPAEVTITVNGSAAARIVVDRLFAPVPGRVLLPVAPFHAGVNHIDIRLSPESSSSAAIRLEGRIHNYYGIAPDFPRVFIVSDEAVGVWQSQQSFPILALTIVVALTGSWLLVLGLTRITRSAIMLASPSIVLLIVLGYSLATPLHIWLSPGAVCVSVAAGLLLGLAVTWTVRHPRKVLRTAALIVLTLGSLEVALRLFNAVKPSFVFYADDYNRYRGHPGDSFFDDRFNSQGFNDSEHAVARPAGVTTRILAIGDSFSVGVVPRRLNYISQLQIAMGADTTEIINMGVAATEPRDYLAILAREGLTFRPDLVLVGIFIGNDFEQTARRPYEYSYVATLARAAWRYAQAGPLPAAGTSTSAAGYHDDEPTLGADRFMEIEVDRSWVYEKNNDRLRVAVARVTESLRQMKDLALGHGAKFVVVLIPDEVQVDPSLNTDVARASGHAAQNLDFDQPNRLLTAALEPEDIRVIDLLPVFRARGASVPLYKPRDTHWNVAGNALAAETIAAALRR
jgi:acetyltransferase AlgX (SGNH hydrolase-like protein)